MPLQLDHPRSRRPKLPCAPQGQPLKAWLPGESGDLTSEWMPDRMPEGYQIEIECQSMPERMSENIMCIYIYKRHIYFQAVCQKLCEICASG